jgi:molecular chaperone GrpE
MILSALLAKTFNRENRNRQGEYLSMGAENVNDERANDNNQIDEKNISEKNVSDEQLKSGKTQLAENGDMADNKTEADQNKESEQPVTSELEKLKAEKDDYYDRLLRASAEFDNYKKRANREMTELRKYANESLTRELLSVVDNLERAIMMSTENQTAVDSIVEGVDMTLKEILKILEKFYVTPLISMGEVFDPRFHQAVGQEESEDSPANTIIKELQKGYMIHDRLLRPAMVIVSKAKPENGDNDNKSDEADSENK